MLGYKKKVKGHIFTIVNQSLDEIDIAIIEIYEIFLSHKYNNYKFGQPDHSTSTFTL